MLKVISLLLRMIRDIYNMEFQKQLRNYNLLFITRYVSLFHSTINIRLSQIHIHMFLKFTIIKVKIIGYNKCWRQKHKCSYYRALYSTKVCKFYHDSGIYIYIYYVNYSYWSDYSKEFAKYANINHRIDTKKWSFVNCTA